MARRSGVRVLLGLALGFGLAPMTVGAQGAGSATLRGTAADASGGVLPGATVTAIHQGTKTVRTATTGSRGEYEFVALTSGTYRVRVQLQGFARWDSGDLHLSPGDRLHLVATLALEDRAEHVTVISDRALVHTDTGAREETISSAQIQNLSLVGRGALELLRILPGVVNDPASYEIVSFTGGVNDLSSYSMNGTRGTTISPVLDGSKIIDPGSNGSVMFNLNPDMVDEVKVQTSNYAAEYGAAGIQVTAVTKSGSSLFHGSVYDYWRNWRFAANDRSNNYAGIPRPKSDYQYPGFNLSGPVLIPGTRFNRNRDKLFFFVGFEYQHQVIDPGTTLAVVPTLKQRQGDFSELLTGAGQNLNQPTTVTIPGGFPGAGMPAPGNDLRPYLDPYGRAFLNVYPLPNYNDPANRYNYAFNTAAPLNRSQFATRLDWNVSTATHAYVRLALENEQEDWPRGVWSCCSSFELPSHVQANDKSRSVSLNVASVLSPSLTNEVILSASRLKLDYNWTDPAKMSYSALGLDGYRGAFDNPISLATLEFFSLRQNLGFFDAVGPMPLYAHNDSISFADTLTKVTGAHAVKLGLFIERGQKQQNFNSQAQGQYYINDQPGATGNDYGDLLVGRISHFYQTTPVPPGEWRFWNIEGYLQDAWKARRNLTIEGGVRVAEIRNNEELNGRGVLFDPAAYDPAQGPFINGDHQRPNGILLASRGEIPKGMTPNPAVALMPRLNVAWDPRGNGDLVVRGGAGLFYNRVQGNFQYNAQRSPPNDFAAALYWGSVPGGLTISNLRSVDPYSSPTGAFESLDPHSVHVPRTWTWSAGLTKRLPWRQQVEVAYVGNRGDHLPNTTSVNYIPPGRLTGTLGNANLDDPVDRVALDAGTAAKLRTYPAYSVFTGLDQFEAMSAYHALQATLSRTAGRVQYFVNYTFSKVLGTTGPGDYALIDPIDARNRSYGIPPQDRTHVFNASYNVALPDPIARQRSAILRGLLDGWQISGITSYRSGAPFRLTFSGDIASLEVERAWWGTDAHVPPGPGGGSSGGTTPVFSGNPRLGGTGVGDRMVDLGSIGIPAFGQSGPFQSPYYLRLPSRWNFDLTLFKNFALGGSKHLQLRLGVFDVFNRAAPSLAMGDIKLDLVTECNVRVDGVPDGAGGTVDGVCDPTRGFHFSDQTKQEFGKIVSKHGHRVAELAVRFDF